MTVFRCDPRAGARTLLVDLIGVRSGQTLAIVAEDPTGGIYDAQVPICVADVARELGVVTRILTVGDHAGLDDMPRSVQTALELSDHVLFHARLGDSLRFDSIPGRASKTMSYALDMSVLGGPSCTVPYPVLDAIRAAYDRHANRAARWRVTCPLGTDVSGDQDLERIAAGTADDFTVLRFPVCAPRPLSCASANGVIAVTHWLMASGHRKYPDDELRLPDVVRVHIKNGKMVDFEGPATSVDRVRRHYRRVGDYLDVDPWVVHSWHAGINPGCFYPVRSTLNLERWGKVAFANPRYLHFHTCGSYAPGEIAWSLFDASAEFDGQPFWLDGRFVFLDSVEVTDILARHGCPALECRTDIGI